VKKKQDINLTENNEKKKTENSSTSQYVFKPKMCGFLFIIETIFKGKITKETRGK
jgi:hypothetical protein